MCLLRQNMKTLKNGLGEAAVYLSLFVALSFAQPNYNGRYNYFCTCKSYCTVCIVK